MPRDRAGGKRYGSRVAVYGSGVVGSHWWDRRPTPSRGGCPRSRPLASQMPARRSKTAIQSHHIGLSEAAPAPRFGVYEFLRGVRPGLGMSHTLLPSTY